MIRIPHQVDGNGHEGAIAEATRLMRYMGYRTVFVFQQPNDRLSSEEFLAFDRSCLLFLNSLRHVDLSFHGTHRKISVNVTPEHGARAIVRISEGDVLDEWEVLHSRLDPKNMLALKKAADGIVPALPGESVFHSFTPTTEYAGAYLKINGDYSTDPSRKTIDVDETSQRSFDEAVSTVTDAIVSLLNLEATKKGFFTPFVNANAVSQPQPKLRLLLAVAQKLQSRTITDPRCGKFPFTALRLKPEWLGYEDYEKLCHGDIAPVRKEHVLAYPEITSFFEQMGVRPFTVQDATERVNNTDITALGSRTNRQQVRQTVPIRHE